VDLGWVGHQQQQAADDFDRPVQSFEDHPGDEQPIPPVLILTPQQAHSVNVQLSYVVQNVSMSELLEHLAANVRRLRDMHGMSLSQLGEKSGVAKP
jgi:hypothetical protein